MEDQHSETTGRLNLRAFGKDLLVYTIGNGLVIIISFILGIFLPKYLSLEGYGYLQLFNLYTAYAGILHLGFLDGLLVRWGGKELISTGRELNLALRFLIYQQVIIILPLSLLTFYILPHPFSWLSLIIFIFSFITNITIFFTIVAQAARMFSLLSIISVIRNIVLLGILITLLALNYLNYQYIIYVYAAILLLVFFTFIVRFNKYIGIEKLAWSKLLSYGYSNIKTGIFILLGNFIVVFFFTIDKLIVSYSYPIEQFAIYAFAAGIIIILYSFVSAIAAVVFPYLNTVNRSQKSELYGPGSAIIITVCGLVLVTYFPFSWLIEQLLPNYVASLPILQILFCSIVFGVLIQVLHVNYFKASGLQRKYFIIALVALIMAAGFIFLAARVIGGMISVAGAMVCSCLLWYILNEIALKPAVEVKYMATVKNISAILSYTAAFWLLISIFNNIYIQTVLYLCLFCLISWFFFRDYIRKLLLKAGSLRKIQGVHR